MYRIKHGMFFCENCFDFVFKVIIKTINVYNGLFTKQEEIYLCEKCIKSKKRHQSCDAVSLN